MKVLFLSRYQFPLVKSGGTGVVVYELMNTIDQIPNIEVEHWTWEPPGDVYYASISKMKTFAPLTNIDLEDARLKKLFNLILTNLKIVENYRELQKFDLIHVHTWELFLVGVLAKYLWSKPLVFTTHDIMQGDRPGEVHYTDIYDFGLLGEKVLASEIDALVAVSEENANLFREVYPESGQRVHVIPNGVNLESFQKRNSFEVFEKYDIPSHMPYIFFIGRASKQKGIEILINTIKKLPTDIPVIIATSLKRWDGELYPQAKEYLNILSKLRLKRQNLFLVINEWDRKLISELYSHASITLMPSVYEPCGMVAMESQACSTPVIATNLGFMKKSILDNETGFLLDLVPDVDVMGKRIAEKVSSVFYRPDLLSRLGSNARLYMEEKHSWETRAKRHLELYQRLAATTNHH